MNMRACRLLARILATGVLAAGCLLAPAAQAAEDLESAVKAAFLVRFGLYVTWPPAAFAEPDAPFVICLLDDGGFVASLRRAAAGQQVQGRPVQIRQISPGGSPAGCHIAYLRGSSGWTSPSAAEALAGGSVLTVADADQGGPSAPGIVNFRIVDDRVRFEIDDLLAARHDLFISSQLLNLAVSVRRRPPKGQ